MSRDGLVADRSSLTLQFDEGKNIAFIRMTGPLSSAGILRAFDAAVSDWRYLAGMGRLWDFSRADLSGLDASTIGEMARYSLRFPPGINDVKVAFVTGRPLEYGLSRMFEMKSEDTKTSVNVFKEMAEAIEWMSSRGD